jgi:hypothetical protein
VSPLRAGRETSAEATSEARRLIDLGEHGVAEPLPAVVLRYRICTGRNRDLPAVLDQDTAFLVPAEDRAGPKKGLVVCEVVDRLPG